MGLIFLIVMGGILGWLAAIVLRVDDKDALWINISAGLAGALTAGILVNPLIGNGNLLAGAYSVDGLLVSLLGSVLLVVSVNLLRGAELR